MNTIQSNGSNTSEKSYEYSAVYNPRTQYVDNASGSPLVIFFIFFLALLLTFGIFSLLIVSYVPIQSQLTSRPISYSIPSGLFNSSITSNDIPNDVVIDFFVRTWHGDGHWLIFLLRSIERFVPRTLYRQIIICYNEKEHDFFTNYLIPTSSHLPIKLVPFHDYEGHFDLPNNGGYIAQMVAKFYAFAQSDADFYVHVDSDTIFNRPITRKDLMDDQHRVYITAIPFSELPIEFHRWKIASSELLGETVMSETMTCFPFVYPRYLYPTAMEIAMIAHGNKTFFESVQECKEIIEFTSLGYVMMSRYPDQYINKTQTERCSMVTQLRSWDGFTPERASYYECLLRAENSNICHLTPPPS